MQGTLLRNLDSLLETDMEPTAWGDILAETETAYYLSQNTRFLPYLAILSYKAGIMHLAKHYYSLSSQVSNVADKRFGLGQLLFPNRASTKSIQMPETEFAEYALKRGYVYQGNHYEYSVISFDHEIGKNLTLLKTRYGSILFDCGAKCGNNQEEMISDSELKDFFKKCQIAPHDIQAVLISHAHLDHYGSLPSLINIGIPPTRIYMNARTKQLISSVVGEKVPYLERFMPLSAFFTPGKTLKITAFPNGHILGSEGYVVSFDNLNVIYTGDYCLHNQQTVDGLQISNILSLDNIRKYGVDCVITETTYGKNTNEMSYEETRQVFNHVIEKLIECKYKVFIPSFAIGRSQEVALLLDPSYRVLIAGLAAKISHIYAEATRLNIYNENTQFDIGKETDVLQNFENHDITLASSGMLAGNSTSSRYLESLLNSNIKTAVIQTGYISSESYGRLLLEQWQNSKFFVNIPLSAHADLSEIHQFLEKLQPKIVVMIHGDGLTLAPDTKRVSYSETPPPFELPLEELLESPKIPETLLMEPKDSVVYVPQGDDVDQTLNALLQRLFDKVPPDVHELSPVHRKSDTFVELYRWLRLYPRYHGILNQVRATFTNDRGIWEILSKLKQQFKGIEGMGQSTVVKRSIQKPSEEVKRSSANSVKLAGTSVTYETIRGIRFRRIHSPQSQQFTCSLCNQTVRTVDYAEFDIDGRKNIICNSCYTEIKS